MYSDCDVDDLIAQKKALPYRQRPVQFVIAYDDEDGGKSSLEISHIMIILHANGT
jgi:uncharacterized lipoprotein YbaY